MVKISVIVPVYNAESELSFCLDSIISQSFSNIEILCINYGSTDDSLKILEQYAIFDPRIKIVNQEHKGIACAKNKGIELAQGEFITFIDTTDRISPLMYERLYHNAKNRKSDVVYCNLIWYNTISHKYFAYNNGFSDFLEQRYKNTGFCENEVEPAIFFEIPCPCWNKIYLCEFIKSKNIKFIEDHVMEDIPFFAQVFLKAQRISFDKNKYYIYRTNKKPSLIQYSEKDYDDIFFMLNATKNIFLENNKWNKYKTLWLLYEAKTLLVQLKDMDDSLKEEYYNKIKRHFEEKDFNEYDVEFLKKITLYSYIEELLKLDYEGFKPILEKLDETQ